MKPFNLEEAKAGKPVCTRDGRKARILCFDRKSEDLCPLIVLVESKTALYEELLYTYTEKGEYLAGKESNVDLMMASEKKEGWINIYYSFHSYYPGAKIYPTKEEALINQNGGCTATFKIEWEE